MATSSRRGAGELASRDHVQLSRVDSAKARPQQGAHQTSTLADQEALRAARVQLLFPQELIKRTEVPLKSGGEPGGGSRLGLRISQLLVGSSLGFNLDLINPKEGLTRLER